MPLQNLDWASFLRDDSELPADISFKVFDNGSVLVPIEDQVAAEPFRIFRAHKFLLAAHSPTFRQQFLGSLPEITNPVLVVLTSSEAFGIVLDFIYLKMEDFVFPCDQFSCLFEVRNLGERYHLADLVIKTELEISERQLSSANLIEATQSAKNFHGIFPGMSDELMMRCNVFFAANYQTREDVGKFLDDHEDSEMETNTILMLIKWKPPQCHRCVQCAQKPPKCFSTISFCKFAEETPCSKTTDGIPHSIFNGKRKHTIDIHHLDMEKEEPFMKKLISHHGTWALPEYESGKED